MSKHGLSIRKHDNAVSKLIHFLHRKGKRYCAIALCASLVAGNMGGLAAIADDGDTVDCAFELDGEKLYEAFQDAIVNGPLDETAFASGLGGEYTDEYISLLDADGSLYELDVEVEGDDDADVSLRVLARLGDDAELQLENNLELGLDNVDTYEAATPSNALHATDIYEANGTEEFIFLLTNSGAEEKVVTIQVDNRISQEITILPGNMIEKKEASDTLGHVVSSGSSGGGSGSSGGGDSSIQIDHETADESVSEEGEPESVVIVVGGDKTQDSEITGPETDDEVQLGESDAVKDTEEVDAEHSDENAETSKETEAAGDEPTGIEQPEVSTGESEASDEGITEIEQPDEVVGAPENDGVTDDLESDGDVVVSEENKLVSDEVVADELGEAENSSVSEDTSENAGNTSEDSEAEVADDVDSNDAGEVDEAADTSSFEENDSEAEDSDTDNSDAGTASDNGEDAAQVAAISFHTVFRVGTVIASPSDADEVVVEIITEDEDTEASDIVTASPSNASPSNATDSNATDSNADLEELEGIIHESVKYEGDGMVAFVVTLDDLGIVPEDLIITKSVQTEDYTVTASYDRNVLPRGVKLVAVELDEEKKAEAGAVLDENAIAYDSFVALDVYFVDENGEEVEPEEGKVQVQIALNTSLYGEAAKNEAATVNPESISVLHFKETGDAIEVEAVASMDEAVEGTVDVTNDDKVVADFAVDSFSTFVVALASSRAAWTVTYTSSDMVAAETTSGPVYDINGSKAFTQAEYQTMLNNVNDSLDDGNKLPITWTRSDNATECLEIDDRADYFDSDQKTYGWTWSMLNGISTSLDDPWEVWDGSRLAESSTYTLKHHFSTYLAGNRISALENDGTYKLYDSATWTEQVANGAGATFHRFRGTFDVSERRDLEGGLYNYAYSINPVTLDADDEHLYVNDDIYVFVYPQSAADSITDDSTDKDYFMNYLAFWAGNSTTWGTGTGETKWNGVPGAVRSQSDENTNTNKAGLFRVTDGWRMALHDDNAGNAVLNGYNNYPSESTYVIDIFSMDYVSGGGMYRLEIEADPVTRYPITIKKVDAVDNKILLSDAVFDLYRVVGDSDNETNLAYSKITTQNGLAEFQVVPGTYILEERMAPDGYTGTTDTWRIVVSDDGTVTINGASVEKDANGVVYYTVTNTANCYDLSLTKNVTGNMGDVNKKFGFTVSWTKGSTSGTKTDISLANGETGVWTDGIPVGAVVTISETGAEKYSFSVESAVKIIEGKEESLSYEVNQTDKSLTFTMPAGDVSIVVENHRDVTIDTGILLDSMPYVLILVTVIAGIAGYVIFKRKKEEDELD